MDSSKSENVKDKKIWECHKIFFRIGALIENSNEDMENFIWVYNNYLYAIVLLVVDLNNVPV
jgi:hypothetical protein